MSKVRKHLLWCRALLNSLDCGVSKAEHGSVVEDNYILEKIRKFASLLGYKLVKE